MDRLSAPGDGRLPGLRAGTVGRFRRGRLGDPGVGAAWRTGLGVLRVGPRGDVFVPAQRHAGLAPGNEAVRRCSHAAVRSAVRTPCRQRAPADPADPAPWRRPCACRIVRPAVRTAPHGVWHGALAIRPL